MKKVVHLPSLFFRGIALRVVAGLLDGLDPRPSSQRPTGSLEPHAKRPVASLLPAWSTGSSRACELPFPILRERPTYSEPEELKYWAMRAATLACASVGECPLRPAPARRGSATRSRELNGLA